MRGGAGANGNGRGGPGALDLIGILRLTSSDGSINLNPASGEGPVVDVTQGPDPNNFAVLDLGRVILPGTSQSFTFDVPPGWVRFVTTPPFFGVQDPSPVEISIAPGLDLYGVIESVAGFPLRRRVTVFNNSAVALTVDTVLISFRVV